MQTPHFLCSLSKFLKFHILIYLFLRGVGTVKDDVTNAITANTRANAAIENAETRVRYEKELSQKDVQIVAAHSRHLVDRYQQEVEFTKRQAQQDIKHEKEKADFDVYLAEEASQNRLREGLLQQEVENTKMCALIKSTADQAHAAVMAERAKDKSDAKHAEERLKLVLYIVVAVAVVLFGFGYM